MVSSKSFQRNLLLVLITLSALILATFLSWPDGKLHLVTCDVGQGDSILIVTPSSKQLLIDGGPDEKVLNCLGRFLPFWDRKVEMVVLTHPQADHMVGLIEVLKRYEVEILAVNKLTNNTPEFKAFDEQKKQEKARNIRLKKGDRINLGDGLVLSTLWPIDGNYPDGNPADLNDGSIILRLEYKDFCAMLTGDAPALILETIARDDPQKECLFLKVAHHGSKNSIAKNFQDQLNPQIAVISAGINNRYGHPHQEAISAFANMGTRLLRTDQRGSIELITNGKSYSIK